MGLLCQPQPITLSTCAMQINDLAGPFLFCVLKFKNMNMLVLKCRKGFHVWCLCHCLPVKKQCHFLTSSLLWNWPLLLQWNTLQIAIRVWKWYWRRAKNNILKKPCFVWNILIRVVKLIWFPSWKIFLFHIAFTIRHVKRERIAQTELPL